MASRSYTPGGAGYAKEAQYKASPAYMAKVLGIKSVKSPAPVIPKPASKRKAPQVYDDYSGDEDYPKGVKDEFDSPAKKPRKKKGEEPEEKRLKRFRVKAPLSYLERLERIKSQRMFMIDRNRTVSIDGTEEVFDMAGSTGNIYQVTISKVPSCNCPDAMKGNQCKHIVYVSYSTCSALNVRHADIFQVLVNVLKAREDLAYQLAFLSTELAEIFAHAPITPQSSNASKLGTDTGGSRKPVEGDCPICVMEFEEGEDIVWCKAACGNNVHRQCFEQWGRSKPAGGK
jgi:hypothetical protein